MGTRPGLPQLREWHDLGFSELRMAVNLSTVQLHHNELPRVVNNLLQAYRLPPRSLELEVTETGLMEDISTAAQHLLSLRRSGALIAIDDFGTGYSSLTYQRCRWTRSRSTRASSGPARRR
jgi:EAL domain-containing protein (putative c-di-GMP-specific phosphodiesterase class I)